MMRGTAPKRGSLLCQQSQDCNQSGAFVQEVALFVHRRTVKLKICVRFLVQCSRNKKFAAASACTGVNDEHGSLWKNKPRASGKGCAESFSDWSNCTVKVAAKNVTIVCVHPMGLG